MANTTDELHSRFEPRPEPQNLTSQEDPTHNVAKNVDYEPHPEKSLRVSPEHQKIIDAITGLYSGNASEELMNVYADKAVYDDPASYCDTRYKIAGQWYGLPKLFSNLETKALEVVEDKEDQIVYK